MTDHCRWCGDAIHYVLGAWRHWPGLGGSCDHEPQPLVRTVHRRPRAGDVVQVLRSGHLYVVDKIHHAPTGGRIELVEANRLDSRHLPNAFHPAEVATVSAVDARRLLTATEGNQP